MPELPEVIVIRNGLKKEVVGKKILSYEVFSKHPLKPSKSDFDKYVVGATINDALNISKLLVLKLSSGYYISIHLKMTGNILFNNSDKYTKLAFKLSDGNALNYSTIRKLGFLEIWDTDKLNKYRQRFGKTALESNLDASEFINLTKGRRKSIRNTLLDQTLVSGIGNIYANEALFLSKINPKSMTNTLTNQQLKDLFKNLQKVLNDGVKNGGSSIDRYKDVYGIPGTQQNHFLVYQNKGNTCTQCKTGQILYEKFQGRGIYYCPTCQKE
jgi:formamidopyrimidine-DNA glycosylase